MVAIIVINEGLLNSINSNYLLWLWSFCHYNCQSSSQWRHHHSVWTHPFCRFFLSAFPGVVFIMVRDPVPNVLVYTTTNWHGLLLVADKSCFFQMPLITLRMYHCIILIELSPTRFFKFGYLSNVFERVWCLDFMARRKYAFPTLNFPFLGVVRSDYCLLF